jgi:hypothetical protein
MIIWHVNYMTLFLVLCVLRITVSDYPFGIFKRFSQSMLDIGMNT